MSDLRAYLERVVLDAAFRDLARSDPDASFAGFALSEADRDVLRRQDDAVLGLLGRVLAPEGRRDAGPTSPTEPAPPPIQRIAMPEIGFLVRVQPVATMHPDGRLEVTCQATVQPVQLQSGGHGGPPHVGEAAPPVSPTPWNHVTAGPEVEAAATAVREAPPEARRDALLGLLGAMTRG
jgi:hypothetical protein